MSITDELREYVVRVHRNGWFDRRVCDDLLEIADRIDAAHRSSLEKVAAMVDEPDELDRLDKRVKALEHLTEGMLLAESEMEGRVAAIERKLNHRGER